MGVAGTMDAGIAPENGGPQNITFEVGPGEVFVVPQGTIHYNYNNQCIPNLFLQSFTSADPGAINVVGALAALRDGSDSGVLQFTFYSNLCCSNFVFLPYLFTVQSCF